jgi:hypothetical protein
MLRKEMTRKEFLGLLTAAFGVLIVNRLPLPHASHVLAGRTPDSYGHGTYGGKKA